MQRDESCPYILEKNIGVATEKRAETGVLSVSMAYASSNLQGYGKREYKKETFEFIVVVDEIYEGGIVRLGLTAEEAKLAPQLYFLSRTIGALLGTFLLVHISEKSYFRVNMLACLASVCMLMWIENRILNLFAIAGIGFFASSVFSIIYSLSLRTRPDKANQISGLVITAIAGGGIVTPLMGVAIDWLGITGGVWISLGCVLLLCFCVFSQKLKCW